MEQRSQVVLVTGAARGIGLALARGFLAAGDAVVAADRDWAGAPEAAAELESAGNALVTGIDITDAVTVDAAVGAALDRYGRLDVCVNNVALRQRDLFPPAGLAGVLEAADADWEAMWRVNVMGTLTVTRRAVAAIRAGGRGGAVVMVSAGGAATTRQPDGSWRAASEVPRNQPYEASKAAVDSMAFTLAADLAPDRIAVNVVFPGPTRTTGSDEMATARAATGFVNEPMLRPEHVVPATVHLAASRPPSGVTGCAVLAPDWNARNGFGDETRWLAAEPARGDRS